MTCIILVRKLTFKMYAFTVLVTVDGGAAAIVYQWFLQTSIKILLLVGGVVLVSEEHPC